MFSTYTKTIVLLICSNTFMTFAWYAHLKNLNNKALWIAILASWGIAFFEYTFQVPENLAGNHYAFGICTFCNILHAPRTDMEFSLGRFMYGWSGIFYFSLDGA
jgi:uncharacterized protein (DUF486 family)